VILAPVAERILESIRDFAQDAEREARRLKVRCPQCGRLVMKRELQKKGCYLCGWKPGDEATKPEAQERKRPYRTRCTRCGTMNVTKRLMEKGCYVCGLKPISLESDFGPTRGERALDEQLGREPQFELDQKGDA